MIELIVIGILVSLSVFSLSMSVDLTRSGREASNPAADAGNLDIDLSGCEQVLQEPETAATRMRATQPSQLSESALEELTQELQALDVRKVDFDLSAMAEDRHMH